MKQLRIVNKVLSIVAIALAGFAIYLAIQWDAADKALRQQHIITDSLFNNYELVRTQSLQASGLLHALSDTNIQPIKLLGMPIAPGAWAYIFWNKANGQVFVNPVNLPQLERDEYYQLWAFSDGHSINLGLINMDKEPYIFQRMRDVDEADEFAVNIVSNGEQKRPLLEKVVVAGSVQDER